MLALIAGRGALPRRIVAEQSEPPLICALQGDMPETLAVDIVFRIERFGSLLAELRRRKVTRVCMAGAIKRPTMDLTRLGLSTLPLLPEILRASRLGDDGALRVVIGIIERAGLRVVGAHELLRDLVMEACVPTKAQPDRAMQRDAVRAARVVAAMAVVDVGQACVVHDGQVLAVEGVFGTDWMLDSLANRPAERGRGGLLYKAPKSDQDRRADLPAVGPATVARAVAVGLDGIVVEAGGVIVLDAERVIADCDMAGLAFWVRAPG